MEDWFSELTPGISLRKAQAKGVCSMTILICWTVWMERNARIFEGKERSTFALVSEIKSEANFWCQAGNKALARVLVVSRSFCTSPA
jgi:hypothetical protein